MSNLLTPPGYGDAPIEKEHICGECAQVCTYCLNEMCIDDEESMTAQGLWFCSRPCWNKASPEAEAPDQD